MSTNKKRRIIVLVIVFMLIVSLASCKTDTDEVAQSTNEKATEAPEKTENSSGETTDSVQTESVNVKYLIPAPLKEDEEMVMEAINQKLADDGVGITLEREGIPRDVWADKLNLKFTSGEEFDMFHIMQDWIPYTSYYSYGELVDITDIVDEYGQVILESVPEDMWEGSKIGGRNYIIPTYWIELAVDSAIFYRADVFEKLNIEIPKEPEDLLEAFRIARQNWEGVNLPILNFTMPSYDAAVLQLSPKLHRCYDDYPFIVKDSFFQVFQDGSVESWFESEDFKKDCAFMKQAYDEGIIQPDILSVNSDWANNYVSNGDWLLWFFTSYENTLKNNPDATVEDMKSFMLDPEEVVLRTWGVKNCNGVSVTSENPEGPIKFINWLWSNQENYDLYMYGLEGVHWEKDPTDARGMIDIKDSTTNANTYRTGDDWKIGKIDNVRYGTSGFMEWINIAYNANPEAENSVAGSFFFDATSVATELANVQAEAALVMTPIVMGVQSYDEYYESAIQRLKDAGLDTLLEEYQEQLTTFINN